MNIIDLKTKLSKGSKMKSADERLKELKKLHDDETINDEEYKSLKSKILKEYINDENLSNQNYGQSITSNKNDGKINGLGLGFVLGFFTNLVGLILGILLGDEDCKRGSIIGFCVSLALGIITTIIYLMICASIPSLFM